MPPPWHPLPLSLKPLQLYRHLLREASYLPPAFRNTIDSTIRKRFHNNRIDGMHTKKRRSKAMRTLRTLRAANSGDKAAMEALVLKGFGRTGNRRRELMSTLVQPQGPGDTQALESILGQTTAASGPTHPTSADSSCPAEAKTQSGHKNSFFEKWDQPKLLQIIRSQRDQRRETKDSTSWPGKAVKALDPDQMVPKTNIWGKPPAASLVRTKRASWWRRNADKIMPPLGRGEWELLQRLSQGAQQAGEWAVPARRPHPLVDETAGHENWDWEAFAMIPTARVEQPRTMSQQRRTGRHDCGPYGGRPRGTEISSRWFRRVYNRTWQLTPQMEQDPNTLQYAFKWGKPAPRLPSPTATQMQIFEGADQTGKPMASP